MAAARPMGHPSASLPRSFRHRGFVGKLDLRGRWCPPEADGSRRSTSAVKPSLQQGEAEAEAVYYIEKSKVHITVASKQGKEGVITILELGEFFGKDCLAGQPLRMATASAMTEASMIRIEKGTP